MRRIETSCFKTRRQLVQGWPIVLLISLMIGEPVIAGSGPCDDPKNLSSGDQLASYCTAAKDADKAIKADTMTMALWGTVVGVCGAACISSFTGTVWNKWICTGTNLGVTAADLGITVSTAKSMQDATTSMLGLGMTGVSTYMALKGAPSNAVRLEANKVNHEISGKLSNDGSLSKEKLVSDTKKDLVKGGKEDVANQVNKKDTAACMAAAFAAVQTTIKGFMLHQQKKAKENALAQAKSVLDERRTAPGINGIEAGSNGTIDPSGNGARKSSELLAMNSTHSPSSDSCSGVQASGSTHAMIQCAVAQDPKLPAALLHDPRFANDFKNASGQDLSKFLNAMAQPGTEPSDVMRDSTAGVTDPLKSSQKFKDLQNKIYSNLEADHGGGMRYASGGGNSQSEGEDPGKQVAEMMGKVMEQLGDGAQDQKSGANVGEVDFEHHHGNPNLWVDNRSLSLFDRVGFRYRKSWGRVEAGPWTTSFNRGMSEASIRRPASLDSESRGGVR